MMTNKETTTPAPEEGHKYFNCDCLNFFDNLVCGKCGICGESSKNINMILDKYLIEMHDVENKYMEYNLIVNNFAFEEIEPTITEKYFDDAYKRAIFFIMSNISNNFQNKFILEVQPLLLNYKDFNLIRGISNYKEKLDLL